MGNRLSRTSTLAAISSTTSTYNANDRLNSDSYDANGNTTSADGNSYAYNFENRIKNVDGGAVTFVYDGDGGVSTTSQPKYPGAPSAPKSAVENHFPVHKTGGPGHYTVELPEPLHSMLLICSTSSFGAVSSSVVKKSVRGANRQLAVAGKSNLSV